MHRNIRNDNSALLIGLSIGGGGDDRSVYYYY